VICDGDGACTSLSHSLTFVGIGLYGISSISASSLLSLLLIIVVDDLSSISVSRIFFIFQELISPGDGTNFPKPGDKLTMHYQ
jgi:hypothetical protein